MRCALCCEKNGTPLHRFPKPLKFPEQFKAWVSLMGENPENFVAYKSKRICDIHFTKKDRNRNNRLNALAVPSLHLPMWCNKPDIAKDSSDIFNTELKIEEVDCAESPQSESDNDRTLNITTNDVNAKEDTPCREEFLEEIDDIAEQPILDTALNFLIDRTLNITDSKVKEEDPCRIEFFEENDDIAEQPILDSASNFLPAVYINEHDYCLSPGSEQIVDTDSSAVSAAPVIAKSHVRGEHNYFTDTSKPRVITLTPKFVISLFTKLKTKTRQIKNLRREILRLRKRVKEVKLQRQIEKRAKN